MREEYNQREISVDAIQPLLDELPESVLEDVGPIEGSRLPWTLLCTLLDTYAALPGADPEGLGARAISSATYKYRRRVRVFGSLLNLEDFLRFLFYPRNPIDFSCIDVSISGNEEQIIVLAYLNDRYAQNETFWRVMQGMSHELFALLNAPVTRSEMHITGNQTQFEVSLARSDNAIRKLRDWISGAISSVLLRSIVLQSYPDLVSARKEYEYELVSRAKVERQLIAAKVAFDSRMQQIDEVIAEFDDQGRMVYASPNMRRVAGMTTTAPNHGFEQLVHPDDWQRVERLTRRALKNREDTRVDDFRVNAPDGRTRWFEASFTHFVTPEGSKHTIAVGRDITERRQLLEERQVLDRELEQTQRLEMLGVLAGGIAHDFNNLLVPILGQADMGLTEVESGSELHRRFAEIRSAAEKASEMVNQLTLYAGGKPPTRGPVDLGRKTEEILALVTSTFASSIKIKTSLQADLIVHGDAAQLQQVIMNLIVNAAEAIGDEPGTVEISTWREGNAAILQVRDDGCGMDKQTQARAFEPFYTTKFAGRGLGLSAVLGIVSAHLGELAVQSEPGAGSSFELRLPLDTSHVSAIHVGEPGAFRGRALLADDEASARATGTEMLESLGFEVAVASDGVEAMERLTHEHFDLAVIDLVMPRADGREVLRAIRRENNTLPVIIISGFGVWSRGAESNADPNTQFLRKPYTRIELSRALDQNFALEARTG